MAVLPWKAFSKQRIPGRLVKYLAILTAFSTASAPLLTNMVFMGDLEETSSFSSLAKAIYGSYIWTIKQVCRYFPAWSRMASTTSSGQCPTLSTPMPPEKSRNSFPSTSRTTTPLASAIIAGRDVYTPLATLSCRNLTRSAFFISPSLGDFHYPHSLPYYPGAQPILNQKQDHRMDKLF